MRLASGATEVCLLAEIKSESYGLDVSFHFWTPMFVKSTILLLQD